MQKIVLSIDGKRHVLTKIPEGCETPCDVCSLKAHCGAIAEKEDFFDTDMCVSICGEAGYFFEEAVVGTGKRFEFELDNYLNEHFSVTHDGSIVDRKNCGAHLNVFDIIDVAKYFYELGQNVK